jgi:hypothetical protein
MAWVLHRCDSVKPATVVLERIIVRPGLIGHLARPAYDESITRRRLRMRSVSVDSLARGEERPTDFSCRPTTPICWKGSGTCRVSSM